MSISKINKRNKIKKRIRKHVLGSESRPRLSVFRSNKEIYAQIVDDTSGKTLASASSRDKDIADNTKTKIGGYLYHGRVKSLAEGAREAGLKF